MKHPLTFMPALFLILAVAGCEQEGPAEEAGERLDEAMEESGAWLKDKSREAGEALEEAGDALEDRARQ